MYNGLKLSVSVASMLSVAMFAIESQAAEKILIDKSYLTTEDDNLLIKSDSVFKDYVLDAASSQSGTVVFNNIGNEVKIEDNVVFAGNENLNGNGGAVANKGDLIFEGNAFFENNTAKGVSNDIYNNGNILIKSGTVKIGSGISGSGNIHLESGSVLDIGTSSVVQNNAVFDEGSVLALKINGLDEYGKLILKGSLENNGAELKATISQNVFDEASKKQDGLSFKLIDGNVSDKFTNTFSNAMYRFEGDGTGNYTVTQIATAADVVGNRNPSLSGAADAWTDNAGFQDNLQKDVADYLNDLAQNNPQAYKQALQGLTPENAQKVQFATNENLNQVFGAVETRLSGGCGFYCSGAEGASSGDELFQRSMVWAQGLYNKAKLSRSDGFDAESSGLAMGAEKYLDLNSKLGLGYAFTNTEIDSLGRDTDVDTHTLFVYGEYKPSRWFVNGIAAYSFGAYKENLLGGNTAKYDVDSISLQAMSGYDFMLGSYTLVPQAGIRYTRSEREAYTDSLRQKISSDVSDVLTAVVGAKLSTDIVVGSDVSIKPELNLAAIYDLENDSADTSVLLSNNSMYTINGRALNRLGIEAGLGIAAEFNERSEVAVGYEGKFRQNYRDHSGVLSYKYKF